MSLEAIVFDMDGLMLDTERTGLRAYDLAAAELGLELPESTYLALVGRPARDSCRILASLLPAHYPIQALFTRAGQLYMQLVESGSIPLKAGVFELLDFIDARGLKAAVATSTERHLAIKKLAGPGLLQRFQTIVCGDDVPRGKPYPDIYLEAANRLGVSPGSCLALEDSIAGIQAAQAAGMTTVMVPDLIAPTEEVRHSVHAIVETLEHVIELIETLSTSPSPAPRAAEPHAPPLPTTRSRNSAG